MVLISDPEFGLEKMKNIIEGLETRNPAYHFKHFRLGIVHQMFRETSANLTSRTVDILTTFHFLGRSAPASMAYAGKTRFADREIDIFGFLTLVDALT
jgi:hypothetical protein